jgi:hypothetical protein
MADMTFWGISYFIWGLCLFSLFVFIILIRLGKKPSSVNFLLATLLCSIAGFLFLPKMHERYFYTSLVFLACFAALDKKWLFGFIFFSLVHLINLYHNWWCPKIPFLINLFSNLTVIRVIILVSILSFGWLLRFYLRKESFEK